MKNLPRNKKIISVTTTVLVLSTFLLMSMVTSSLQLANADRNSDANQKVKDRISEVEKKIKDRLNRGDDGSILTSPGNIDAFSEWDPPIPDINIRG